MYAANFIFAAQTLLRRLDFMGNSFGARQNQNIHPNNTSTTDVNNNYWKRPLKTFSSLRHYFYNSAAKVVSRTCKIAQKVAILEEQVFAVKDV